MPVTNFVGISEMKISDNPSMVLVAANLGSCMGVAAYDPKRKVGGIIHCLLPSSSSDPSKAKANPCMYVDTGVAHFLEKLIEKGSKKTDLILVAVGGAALGDSSNVFEIGKNNFAILRKLLWKNNLLLKAHDVGGEWPRTISLYVDTGQIWLKAKGEIIKLV